MEFVINLTTRSLAYATDWCGVNSGKDHTKFEEMKLTPGKASVVNDPIIEECPLCIECRVKEVMALGSHGHVYRRCGKRAGRRQISGPGNGSFRYAACWPAGLFTWTNITDWATLSVNSAGRSERKNSHEENLPYIADTSILFLGQRPEVYQDRRQDIQLGRKKLESMPRSRLSNRWR